MKKIFFSAVVITLVLVSCNQKTKDDSNMMHKNTTTATDSTQTESQVVDSKLYACPMHPEVQGKMDDECSKCGMKLTEPVK